MSDENNSQLWKDASEREAVVQRFRNEKHNADEADRNDGLSQGREWAKSNARPDEAYAVLRWKSEGGSVHEEDSAKSIVAKIFGREVIPEEIFGDDAPSSVIYLNAFFTGAWEIFKDIEKDGLEAA